MSNNLVNYPPMLSLIRMMAELGKDVYYIGSYSDELGKAKLEKLGVTFVPVVYERVSGQIEMIKRQNKYKSDIKKVIQNYSVVKDDLVWYVYSDTAYFLLPELKKLSYVAHFYEFVNSKLSWKYQLLYPTFKMKQLLHNAKAVVHCEYNRAQITKGLYGLDKLPYVIPNKPYFEETDIENAPKEIRTFVEGLKARLNNKTIILYQGVFESNERRLEEFCEAAQMLPDNFVFIAMGSGGDYFNDLKQKYESDKILFIPFIKPPYHLLVTKLASIGVLSYYPLDSSFAGVINPLYCAPNKVFEYGRYGVPMISNDIPGLKYIFKEYNCGKVVESPITARRIVDTVTSILGQNSEISKGSLDYYDSVDIRSIVSTIIKDIESY